jgi:hypothetical protein
MNLKREESVIFLMEINSRKCQEPDIIVIENDDSHHTDQEMHSMCLEPISISNLVDIFGEEALYNREVELKC